MEDNKDLYGRSMTNREITQENVRVPPAASKLVDLLDKYSPHREKPRTT